MYGRVQDIAGRTLLLLDMNGTFMFGEDRFGENEDYSLIYRQLGGGLPADQVNRLIAETYTWLEQRYPDPQYREQFPALSAALKETAAASLPVSEINLLIDTFAYHELGYVAPEYAAVLHRLSQEYLLAAVIDIWAPKRLWLETFREAGIDSLFSAYWFSSDHGIVKPSPRAFHYMLDEFNCMAEQTLMIGDSVNRDLLGAAGAGIDCILVGGEQDPRACACFDNLPELADAMLGQSV